MDIFEKLYRKVMDRKYENGVSGYWLGVAGILLARQVSRSVLPPYREKLRDRLCQIAEEYQGKPSTPSNRLRLPAERLRE